MKTWTITIGGETRKLESEEEVLNFIGEELSRILTGTSLEEVEIVQGKEKYDIDFDIRLVKAPAVPLTRV